MISTKIATPEDSQDLCTIMHETALPGFIHLSYTRDPDFFAPCKFEGFKNQVFVSKEAESIGTFAIRSIRNVFLNGKEQTVGYIHAVRTKKEFRKSSHFLRAFLFLRQLHHSDNLTPMYLATTIDYGTDIFQRLSGTFAYCKMIGKIVTHSIPVKRTKNRVISDYLIVKGTIDDMDSICAFLKEQGSQRQFYPVYSKESLNSLSEYNLNPENFYIAKVNNAIIGIIAVWDQRAYKQLAVKKFSLLMNIIRNPLNVLLKQFGYYGIPDTFTNLKTVYGCCIAIKDNSIDLFTALLTTISNDLAGSGIEYLCIGLHDSDPLLKALNHRFTFSYKSRLYAFSWKNGVSFVNILKPDMIPYLEISTL